MEKFSLAQRALLEAAKKKEEGENIDLHFPLNISLENQRKCLQSEDPLFCANQYDLPVFEREYMKIAKDAKSLPYYQVYTLLKVQKEKGNLKVLEFWKKIFEKEITPGVKTEIRDFLMHVGKYYKGDLEFFFKEVPENYEITNENYYDVLTGACQNGNELIIKQILEKYNPQWIEGRDFSFSLYYDLFVHNISKEIIDLFVSKFPDANTASTSLSIKFDRLDLFKLAIISFIKIKKSYDSDDKHEIEMFYSLALLFNANKIMKFIEEELKGIKGKRGLKEIDFSTLQTKPFNPLNNYIIPEWLILLADPNPFSFIDLEKEYLIKIVHYQAERNNLAVVKYYLDNLKLKSIYDSREYQSELEFKDIFTDALFNRYPIETNNYLLNHFYSFFIISGGWDEAVEGISIIDTFTRGIWNYQPEKGWYNKMIHDNDDYLIRYLKYKDDQKTLNYLLEFEKKHNVQNK